MSRRNVAIDGSDSGKASTATVVGSLLDPATETDRERRRVVLLCLPYFLLATFGAFVPLAVMARMSVSTDRFANVGFTSEAWRTLVTDPIYREIALNTLWFAAATTVFSVACGVVLSHVLATYDLPFERAIVSIVSFPIALPVIVVAFMIVVLLGRTGLVTNAIAVFTGRSPIDLASARSLLGLFLGYVFSLIPRSTMVLRGTFAEVDEATREAARALGASPLAAFYHVVLPQVWPGIVAALVLTFRTALAIFGTVLVLPALNVATLRIDLEIQDLGFNSQIAGAIGLVYFLFLFVVTFGGLKLIDDEYLRI